MFVANKDVNTAAREVFTDAADTGTEFKLNENDQKDDV